MEEILYEVIKWVMIVFLAGFIGYFGKHLSKYIIRKFSKKQKPKSTIVKVDKTKEYQAKIEKEKLKIEKKRLKASAKKQKK